MFLHIGGKGVLSHRKGGHNGLLIQAFHVELSGFHFFRSDGALSKQPIPQILHPMAEKGAIAEGGALIIQIGDHAHPCRLDDEEE